MVRDLQMGMIYIVHICSSYHYDFYGHIECSLKGLTMSCTAHGRRMVIASPLAALLSMTCTINPATCCWATYRTIALNSCLATRQNGPLIKTIKHFWILSFTV